MEDRMSNNADSFPAQTHACAALVSALIASLVFPVLAGTGQPPIGERGQETSASFEDTLSVHISGTVTDFEGTPIGGAAVELKKTDFQSAYRCLSDAQGKYHLLVEPGSYIALTAIVTEDYATKKLEYWAWNIPAFRDLEINPRYDRIEVYAMNAWRPQGALPSLQVYFRPMTLQRVVNQGGVEALKTAKLIDIAPELTHEDIVATIDGQQVAVLHVNKVLEAAPNGQLIFGYLIQIALPEKQPATDYWRICLMITDPATGEMGEGLLFWEKRLYR
jgi:hypothetical protein